MPDRRWLVHHHVHSVAPELSALQGFDCGGRGLILKLDKSKAAGAARPVAGDADGADISIDREHLPQVAIGGLWG